MNEIPKPVAYSAVIPTYNEVESVTPLAEQLVAIFDDLGQPYEIIFIDDGSYDGTTEVLRALASDTPPIKLLRFRRNFGKAAALNAGFQKARGDIIFTLDADLQDEPSEIPRFLDALEQGSYDLVSGWKYPRLDPLSKTLPSKLFNAVTSWLGGVKLHDFNCGFKAYRRAVVQEVPVYGMLYRFIPVLAHWRGFRVGEIKVKHHPRRFGKSKYGFKRFARGFFDLLTVLFLTRYLGRPLHLFGWLGVFSFLTGTGISAYLTVLWFLGERPIGNRPLLTLGVLLIIVGVQFFTLGLLAQLLIHLMADHQANYSIDEEVA